MTESFEDEDDDDDGERSSADDCSNEQSLDGPSNLNNR